MYHFFFLKQKTKFSSSYLKLYLNKVTRVTLESFLAWKARKLSEKKDEIKKKEEKKRADFKLGFMNGLTGRDLFTFNPDMIQNDDDDVGNDIDYRRREGEEEENDMVARELNTDYFASLAREVDNSGTIATNDRFSYLESMLADEKQKKRAQQEAQEQACAVESVNGDEEEGEEEDDEEGDEVNEDEEQSNLKNSLVNNDTVQSKNKKANGIEIDESLFNLDDLADIQDELENLDIE
jgi:hypothetical protein